MFFFLQIEEAKGTIFEIGRHFFLFLIKLPPFHFRKKDYGYYNIVFVLFKAKHFWSRLTDATDFGNTLEIKFVCCPQLKIIPHPKTFISVKIFSYLPLARKVQIVNFNPKLAKICPRLTQILVHI
jgi:hypothetical protein